MRAELPPTSEPSDADLVRRAKRGDPEALNLLFARDWPAFLAYAHAQWQRDWHEAQDLCQEACMKSIARLGDLREPARFRSWVMGFIVNVARNWRRTRGISGTGGHEVTLDDVESMTATSPSTVTQADFALMLAELASLSRNLDGLVGEVVRWMLVVFAETGELPSVTQIAERFGLSHGNAQRAREAVLARSRETLERYGFRP